MASESINQNNVWGRNNRLRQPAKAGSQTADSFKLVYKHPQIKDSEITPIVRYAFYGYVATIPFETVNLGIPLELTMISLGFLLMSLIFQIPLCLQKPPAAFWLYFLYLVIFAIPVYTSTPAIYFDEAKWQLAVLVQLVVMSWVAFNIMKSERAARGALLTLALSCALLACLQQIGVSDTRNDISNQLERISAFGFHPNNLARILSLGVLALAGLTYAMSKRVIKSQLLVWGMIGLIGLSIVQTGSRGALLALVAGFLVFVLKRGAVSTKIRNAAIVLIGIIFFTVLVFQSEMGSARFESAVEEGNLARRETIYPEAWRMFLEKPVFGWGAKVSEYELGARLGHVDEDSKNPHNLILFVLLSSGLVGLAPLMLGILLTFKIAWKARDSLRGVLPLSLLVTILVANMSGVYLHNKMHWLVMAYVLSSSVFFNQIKTMRRKIMV